MVCGGIVKVCILQLLSIVVESRYCRILEHVFLPDGAFANKQDAVLVGV